MATSYQDLDLAFGAIDSNINLTRNRLLSPPPSSPLPCVPSLLLLLLLLLGTPLRSRTFLHHSHVFFLLLAVL